MNTQQTDSCVWCESAITLASDGAWEDESGACGCGSGEHFPHTSAGSFTRAVADNRYQQEEDQ